MGFKNVSKTQMDTTFSYKNSKGFEIKNGIMSGPKGPVLNDYVSFGEFVLDRLKADPEFVGQVNALTDEGETFSVMTEKSVKCAMWLKEQCVKPGDIVGICTHTQMDMYVPFFASLFIGAVTNPWWNNGVSMTIKKHFLSVTRPSIIFVDGDSAESILEGIRDLDLPTKVIVFGDLPGFLSLNDILASQRGQVVSDFRCTTLPTQDHPAAILFTSGSTGLPKGVIHTQRSLFGNVRSFVSMGKLKGPVRLTTFWPLGWNPGLLTLLRATVQRETRVVHPKLTEEITFQLIEKFKMNWVLVGMGIAARLLKSSSTSNYDLSSLEFLFVAGSLLREETHRALAAKFPGVRVIQPFGITEFGGLAIDEPLDEAQKFGSCGKAIKNVMIKVIDTKSGHVLGPNQLGEGCFKSPYMTAGYYKNPEATKKLFDADGWLHSGDLIHYDEEGSVFITDRIEEMIRYKEHRVSPTMIENVLLSHPEVWETSVVARPDPVDGQLPLAFVVKMPNATVTKDELEKLVATKLPDSMKLRGGIEFLTDMPRTSTNKVSRTDLKKIAESYKAR